MYQSNLSTDELPCTEADFIIMWGFNETVALTNPDDLAATTVNSTRLSMALDDAAAYILNHLQVTPWAAMVVLAGSYRRVQATIARYYLDSVRPRAAVTKDYEQVIKLLDTKREVAWTMELPGSPDSNPRSGKYVRTGSDKHIIQTGSDIPYPYETTLATRGDYYTPTF